MKLTGLFLPLVLCLLSQQAAALEADFLDDTGFFSGLDDTAEPPREPGKYSVVLHDQAKIFAEPSAIWKALVDLPGYSDWNPWIRWAEGDVSFGGIVHVDVVLNGIKLRAKHVVLTVEPESVFCWRDAGWNANFVYAQRCRTLVPQDDGSVLVKVDLLIDGFLSKSVKLTQGRALRAGMAAELGALKRYVEGQP